MRAQAGTGALYFGDPRGALALLERGLPLVGVVHGRRGGPGWLKLLPLLREAGIPRWMRPRSLTHPELLERFATLKPSLIVSGFYPRQLPPALLALAPGINVHPSDLPQHRGPDPAWWAIREGRRETAICVHRLLTGLDEGEVVRRLPIQIGARESGGRLAERLEARAAELLGEVAAELLAGGTLPLHPQEGESSWAPLVPPEEQEIDWRWPATEVDHLVRAAAPDPGAFSALGGETITIFRGRPCWDERWRKIPPGFPIVWEGGCAIRCGGGAFRLDLVQLGVKRLRGAALAAILDPTLSSQS